MRGLLRSLLAVAVLTHFASVAQGASIISAFVDDQSTGDWGDTINPEPDGTNVGPNFEDDSAVSVPNGWNEWRTQGDGFGSVTAGDDNTFSTSHGYHVATQAQNAITSALYYDGTVRYEIAVSSLPDEQWELTINVANAGTVTHTDEDAGFIEISSSTSFGTVTAPSRSGFSTSGPGTAAASGSTSFGSNTNFNDTGGSYNQNGSFLISGTGPQTVEFTLMFEINTDIMGELSFGSGDSLCFNGGLAAVGDGPNTNCTVGAGTGLGVTGSLLTTFVPEPGTAVLVGIGLFGLAAGRRRLVA